MSQEQISGILEETRAALCSDAMSFVGRIPYYWGGKATVQSYEGNGFNTAVMPDYKGRDRKGLDCSGFVQWTIWRVTGIKRGGFYIQYHFRPGADRCFGAAAGGPGAYECAWGRE